MIHSCYLPVWHLSLQGPSTREWPDHITLSLSPPTPPKATKPSSTRGHYLSNEVLVLLHEVVQVVLVLINALQEVRPLKLQPVQLLVYLRGQDEGG